MDDWFSPLPLLTPGTDGGRSRKSLSRAFAAGGLVRVRQGFYVETDTWVAASPSQRFITTVKAVAARLHQPIFTGGTALVLRGIPWVDVPATVDVVTATASRAGLQTTMPAYHEAHIHRFGDLPFVHRTRNVYRELPFPTEDLSLDSLATSLRAVELGEDLVGALAGLDFAGALVVLDNVLSGRNRDGVRLKRMQVAALVHRDASATESTALNRVLRLATHLSESAGESLSRACMIELGFVLPELQVVMTGADGVDYRVDFWWEKLGLVGEFDGWGKYAANKGTSDPDTAFRQEKRREDALRERGIRFMRWEWDDVLDPQRFAELLVRNGVPRRRRASIRWTA